MIAGVRSRLAGTSQERQDDKENGKRRRDGKPPRDPKDGRGGRSDDRVAARNADVSGGGRDA